VSDSDLK